MPYTPFDTMFITPVLPFLDDGSIDEDGYRALLRTFLTPANIDAGVAVIANPEAGEVFTLDPAERRHVITMAIEETAGRAPVLAGVIDVSTAGAVAAARDAAELGVDGLFVFPPIGAGDITLSWVPDQYPEVLVDLLTAIADAVDLPQVVHPVGQFSARYGPGLSAAATRHVIEAVPQIVGWKMTYNYDGYREITRVLRGASRRVNIHAALGKYMHENLANDVFDGTASGAFNYALEPMLEHIAAWRAGDVERATAIWNGGLAELQEYVFSDFGRLHVRYKAATWLRGFIANPLMRAPMPKPRRAEIDELVVRLDACGVSILDKESIDASVERMGLA